MNIRITARYGKMENSLLDHYRRSMLRVRRVLDFRIGRDTKMEWIVGMTRANVEWLTIDSEIVRVSPK